MDNKKWPTITEMFLNTCSKFPDNRCFTSFGHNPLELTYKESEEIVKKTASWLIQQGTEPGTAIALIGKNTPQWTVAYLSVLLAGGTLVPIDSGLSAEKIESLLDRAECQFVFADQDKLNQINEETSLKKISLTPGSENYLLNLQAETRNSFPEISSDSIAAIMFTSGTTGQEKGVVLYHSNFTSDVYSAQEIMKLYSTDVFYALLPLHHSYSMSAVFLQSISVGAEIVFAEKLSIDNILKDLKEGKVTMFLGIPMLFNKLIAGMLKKIREKGLVVYGLIKFLMFMSGAIKKLFNVNPGKKIFHSILQKVSLDTNRICISGGAPLPAATFRQFNQLGIDFVQGYGLTETAPILCLNPVDDYKVKSVGKVLPGIHMKILDPDEKGIGEIAVKGPMIFKEYFQDPLATKAVFTEDGYFITGDMGYLDDENYLYLTGRKKSLIVTEGGKNVYPEEIEDKFQLYTFIDQVLIRGYLKDEKNESEGIEVLFYLNPEYTVEMRKDEIYTEMTDIVKEVNRNLRPYQRIDKTTVLNEPMAMTTTKKIKRFRMNM